MNLFAFRFPVMAIASILHRISGLMLVFGLPALIWGWSYSLTGETAYRQVASVLQLPPFSVALWLFASLLFYHLLAGVKHLLMDLGWGEELRSAKLLSRLVILFGLVFSLVVFYLLFL